MALSEGRKAPQRWEIDAPLWNRRARSLSPIKKKKTIDRRPRASPPALCPSCSPHTPLYGTPTQSASGPAAKGKRKRPILAGAALDASALPTAARGPSAPPSTSDAPFQQHSSYGDDVLALCGGPAGAAALDACFLGGASPTSATAGPVAAHLASAFTQWAAALVALQPKCVVGPSGVARGVRVLARYVSVRGPGPIALAEAAAAFWVAVKIEGTRSAVPSRALLARATAVPPSALSSAEVGLLCAVAFDVFGGDIAADPGEEVCAGYC